MSVILPCIICGPYDHKLDSSFGGYKFRDYRLCNNCANEKVPYDNTRYIANNNWEEIRKRQNAHSKKVMEYFEKLVYQKYPEERMKKQASNFEPE